MDEIISVLQECISEFRKYKNSKTTRDLPTVPKDFAEGIFDICIAILEFKIKTYRELEGILGDDYLGEKIEELTAAREDLNRAFEVANTQRLYTAPGLAEAIRILDTRIDGRKEMLAKRTSTRREKEIELNEKTDAENNS